MLCFMNNLIHFGRGERESKRDGCFRHLLIRHLLNLSTVETNVFYTLIWGSNVGIGLVTEV